MKGKTILLVEDEAITAAITKSSLKKYGFSVIHVNSGELAIETVDNVPDIDLILMDIDLGEGIDGTEAGAIILKKHDVPLVFVSSHKEPEIVNKTKSITNYGYIVKGTGEVVLMASIEMALKLFESNRTIKDHLNRQKNLVDIISGLHSDIVPPVEILIEYALGSSMKLTGSASAFYGFIDETTSTICFHTMSKEKSPKYYSIKLHLSEAGIFGECVTKGKHIIINGHSGSSEKTCFLPEHDDINNILAVPVFSSGRVVGIGAVANSDTPFDITDVQALISLFQELWGTINTRELLDKIKANEGLFRTMLDLVPDLISIQDLNMNIIYSNWQGIGNVSENRKTSLKCHKAYHNYSKICPDCFIDELLKQRCPMRFEKENADGSWHDIHIIPLFDKNNEIIMFMEWVRDITADKAGRERFRFLTRHLPSMICEFLPDSTLLYVNDAYCKYFDMPPEELTGRPFIELIPPSERKSVMENYLSLSPEKPIKKYTHHVNVKGNTRIQEWTNRAIFDSSGQAIKFISIGKDITETLYLKQDLEDKTNLLSGIMDNMFDMVSLTDLQGNITFVSRSHYTLGYDLGSLKGSNVLDYVHPEDLPRIKSEFSKDFDTWKNTERVEYRFRRADGKFVWLETLGKSIKNKNGDIKELIFSSRDITERKESEIFRQFLIDFHKNIARISFSMVRAWNETEFNNSIDELLKYLGENFGVNRSYMYIFSNDLATMCNTHEWCSKGTVPQRQRLQNIQIRDFSWWTDQFFKNGIFNVPIVNQLPIEASTVKDELQKQEVQSIIEVAVYDSKGSFTGFIGFDMVDSTRTWSEEEIAILKIVAGIIGTTIERNRYMDELSQSEARFRALHNASFGGIAIHEEGRILDSNEGLSKITGFSSDGLIGMNILNLISENSRDLVMDKILSGHEGPYEALGLTKDKREFPVLIEARNIYYKGKRARVAEFRDITDQKQAEERLKKALKESEGLRARAQSLLSEKELILKESHHRIKNNMNTIYSLLQLRAMESKDTNAAKVINESASTIKAMMMLYNKLYLSQTLNEVNVRDYLPQLIDEISSLLYSPVPVTLKSDIEDIVLSIKVLTPLNIIINELISNSFKHAFTAGNTGQINISLIRKGNNAVLTYKDNGTWTDEQHDNGPLRGMQIVEGLVMQIKGLIDVHHNPGAEITIEFNIT